MSKAKSSSVLRHSVAPGQIALTSRRSSKTHLVPFDKGTAAMYLRQTEQLWLMPNLSRQEGQSLSLSLSLSLFLPSLYTHIHLYHTHTFIVCHWFWVYGQTLLVVLRVYHTQQLCLLLVSICNTQLCNSNSYTKQCTHEHSVLWFTPVA